MTRASRLTSLGRASMRFMAEVIEQTYGMHLQTSGLQVDKFWAGIAFLLGVAASMAGAFLPARAASRVDPALALQKGKHQTLSRSENRLRRRIGMALGIACIAGGFSPWAQSVAAQSVIVSVLFVSLALLVLGLVGLQLLGTVIDVERGTHQTLLAAGGVHALLHEEFIRYLSARLSLFLRMEFGLKLAGLSTITMALSPPDDALVV